MTVCLGDGERGGVGVLGHVGDGVRISEAIARLGDVSCWVGGLVVVVERKVVGRLEGEGSRKG